MVQGELTGSTAESVRQCLAAFLLGYVLAESGVSVTALMGM